MNFKHFVLPRYAFTPLLDRDEDYSSEEEDDILYSDAWEGLKMRGTGSRGYRPDSPDGKMDRNTVVGNVSIFDI